MPLDSAQVLRRLAFIRYLHQLGIDQARLPEPMCSAAVLMFHDAAEHLLLMVAEHLGQPDCPRFMDYWKELRPTKVQGGLNLPAEPAMRRLNEVRKSLKHHGNLPSLAVIEQCKDDVRTFLAATTHMTFGYDYDSVSMANVIPQEAVRELVVRADAAEATEDHVTAMIHLVDAWEVLFRPWPKTIATDAASPFRFGPTIHNPLRDYDVAAYLHDEEHSRLYPRRNEDIGRQFAQVTEIVQALQSAAQMTAIGVNFAEYRRYLSLTPRRSDFFGGRRTYRAPAGYAPTGDDVGFCLQFVVTAALRLAEAEAQVIGPPWLAGRNPWHVQWETVLEIGSGK